MAQLSKKFLKDNAVGASKIQLENDAFVRSRNFADSADIDMLKVNASDVIEFASVPQSPSDAVLANDLVRYSQIATALEGMKPKQAVAAVSLVDIDLAVAADPSPVDGHALVDGDRILLAGQTDPAENGIYVAVTAIDPTSYVRAADYDAVSEIPGSYTVVQFGGEAGSVYLTTSNPSVLNTDPIVFIKKAQLPSFVSGVQRIVLLAGDITNQYIDLAYEALGASAADNSVAFKVIEGGPQDKTVDYSVDLTGGVAGVTRITFLAGLATGGVSELVAGDILEVSYSRLN
jgi:hypothetical protein